MPSLNIGNKELTIKINTMKIDKHIPIPKNTRGAQYPFAKMQVGDSFHIDTKNPNTFQTNVRMNFKNWCYRNGKKWNCTIRKEEKGLRFWRVK